MIEDVRAVVEADRIRIGDEVNLMAAVGEFESKLGCHDAAAAIGGITSDADSHDASVAVTRDNGSNNANPDSGGACR